MPLSPGTRLGPYEILEPLGAGGMGEVYRARDPRLSRDVAVKLVTTDGVPSPDRLRRFETEARAAAQLSHPNVITVFDVGTHEGQPYLVLELLEGKTLRETLRGAAPSLREAVGWGLDAARGLGAAHERGIVHRDLKPENVFLTEDGRIKVLDFGLAKLHEPLVDDAERESPTEARGTKPGMVLGTVGYMAPQEYDLDSGELKTLERWDARGVRWWDVDPGGRWVALTRVDDNRVLVRPFWGQGSAVERVIGRHEAPAGDGALSPAGDRLATGDTAGEIRIWSLDKQAERPLRTLQAEGWVTGLRFDPSGRSLAASYSSDDGANTLVRVWDLEGPESAEPVALRTAMYEQPFPAAAFGPTSSLVVVSYLEALGLFTLEQRAHVLPGPRNLGGDVAFTPDGRTLLTGYEDGTLIRTWRLDGQGQRDLRLSRGQVKQIAVDPAGRHLVVAGLDGAFLVDLSDGTSRELPDTSPRGQIGFDLAISADGRFAAAPCLSPPEHEGIRVWDLESLELRVLDESRGRNVRGLAFAPNGELISSDASGIVSRWDLQDDLRTTLVETGKPTSLAFSPNGRHLLAIAGTMEEAAGAVTRSTLYDLVAGTARPFTSHGDHVVTAAFDPTSQWIVTGDRQGVVRVGPINGETPHLLVGHDTPIRSVAFSPDGRWIASSESLASTVRLWPRPDGPPLQTWPYPELMTRLRAMTNLRVVPDATSPMGCRLEVGPFPGWGSASEP